jgi:hypothetical protein
MCPEGCLWRRKVGGPIQNIPGDTKMSIFRFGIDNTELQIVANYRLRGGVSFLIIAIAN